MNQRINFAWKMGDWVQVNKPSSPLHKRVGTVVGVERGGFRVEFAPNIVLTFSTDHLNTPEISVPHVDEFTEGQIVHHTDRDSYGQIDTIVATGEGDTETIVLYVKELNDDTGEFSGPLRAWFADHCTVADTEPAEVPNCYVPGYGHLII